MPGTAHGFIFLSIEDETGISNAIIDPELYEHNRSLVAYARFLLVEGTLQIVDKVIHIRARHIEELDVTAAPTRSHDFHSMRKHMTSPGDSEPPKDWWLKMLVASRHSVCDKQSILAQTQCRCVSRCEIVLSSFASYGNRLSVHFGMNSEYKAPNFTSDKST